MARVRWGGSVLCAALAGCGGAGGPTATESTSAASAGGERPAAPDADELVVVGLRGSLSQSEIQNALEPRMIKLSRCVERRADEVEWVSGRLQMDFHIALDGGVASVFPSASSMGDRVTERCMLEVAHSVRFPAPHGGEADFSWPIDVPIDPDVREPMAWDAEQASDVLLQNAQATLDGCGGGSYAITAYVDPDGAVVAAGASVTDPADADKLDCITDAIRGWTFPSPGSYAAKVSFGLR